MLNVMWIITTFLLALMILVAVHEYGHFWVARRVGVKVLRFSIGFGKVLFSWHDKKGTEYAISVIPLGGYVKMLDEREGPVDEADLPYAFNRKPLWARIAVVLAGPLYNLLFAIVAYWLMFCIGITQFVPIIGNVAVDSIASEAGLKSQQEIVAINGKAVQAWQDARIAIIETLGDKSQLTMTTVPVGKTEPRTTHRLSLANWVVDAKELRVLDSLGIKPSFPTIPAVIGGILDATPASNSSLEAGDEVLAINGKKVSDWQTFVETIASMPDETVHLKIKRDDKTDLVSVPLGTRQVGNDTVGYIGVQAATTEWPEYLMRTNRYNPIAAIIPAVESMWDMFMLSWKMLGKMFTGSLSLSSLSGPIGIAQGAGMTASLGISYYLNFLALISISLAMVNLLPIPMLDGGHLLYYLIEAVTRKPVSERVQMMGVRVGLAFLMLVMAVAFYNDVMRW